MNSDLQTQPSRPAFADVPMSQANSKAPLKQKVNFPVWSLQLHTHIHSQITLTPRIQTYLLFTQLVSEFCSETKSTTKFLLNKLKHITHWSPDKKPLGKLGENDKKREIFRLKESSPISLQCPLHLNTLGSEFISYKMLLRQIPREMASGGIWGLLITGHHRYNL